MEMQGANGQGQHTAALPLVALDLWLAGVRSELAEQPFDWFGPVVAAPRHGVVAVSAPAAPPLVVPPRQPTPARVEALPTVRLREEPLPLAQCWRRGEPGGVVLAVVGEASLAGPEATLVQAMLAAVGLAAQPVGWVGLTYWDAAQQAAWVAELSALAPQQVLLLGQDLWPWADVVPVPVARCFAPALLLAQPLMKKQVWLELQRWQRAGGWQPTRQRNSA